MILDFLRVRAEHTVIKDGFNIYVFIREPGGDSYGLPDPLVIRTVQSGALMPEPLFTLPKDSARELMDDLWNAGVRPTNYQDARGEVSAQSKHIASIEAEGTRLHHLLELVLRKE